MTNLHKRLNKTTKIAVFSGSLLVAALATCLYSPVFKTNAAEESADVNVEVNPIISITLSTGTLSFDVAPTVEGSFNQKPLVATVDTNSTGGYELYFSSEDSATAMTSLTSTSTITSDFSGTVTSSTMASNKWGYSLDTTDFSKIPALADQAKIKDLNHFPTSNEKDTTVYIATKIDNSLPSGTYSKRVLFTAVAHASAVPVQVISIHSIATMQEMTSQICADTTTPATSATKLDWDGSHHNDTSYVPRTSLKDTRDDKYYLVSKLADGNCWMSQNLELRLNKNTALTDEKTDLNTKSSWTPENSTRTSLPTTSTWPTSNATASSAARSYYPIASDRYYRGGTEKSSTPTASDTEYDWEKAGIYYNWFAATAGSGIYSLVGEDTNDSICPKGWRLPSATIESKSLRNLITTTYGVAAATAGETLTSFPFNIPLAGYFTHNYTKMYGQGVEGWLLYSTPNPSNNEYAYNLCFTSSALHPRVTNSKGLGIPVRCVAR